MSKQTNLSFVVGFGRFGSMEEVLLDVVAAELGEVAAVGRVQCGLVLVRPQDRDLALS
jgi:hypothetical protein